MSIENLMWGALEGALGPEKTASLRYSPLNEIMPQREATSTVAHAATYLAAQAQQKHAADAAIASGLRAMRMLGAERPMAKMASHTSSITEKAAHSRKLEAIERGLNAADRQKVAAVRRQVNVELMGMIKEARGILEGISKNPTMREMGKKMLGGAAVGTGAAIPATIAGSHLSDTFTEDARDRALQAAAGTAALGVGAYGLGQMMKQSSLQHLATAVYLDELLASKQQTEKVAALREMNREFVVHLLMEKEAKGGAGIDFPIGKGWATDDNTLPPAGVADRAKGVAKRMAKKKTETTKGPGGTTVAKRKGGPGGATT